MPSRQGRPSLKEKDQRRWATLKMLMPREIYEEVQEAIEIAKRLGEQPLNRQRMEMISAKLLPQALDAFLQQKSGLFVAPLGGVQGTQITHGLECCDVILARCGFANLQCSKE